MTRERYKTEGVRRRERAERARGGGGGGGGCAGNAHVGLVKLQLIPTLHLKKHPRCENQDSNNQIPTETHMSPV